MPAEPMYQPLIPFLPPSIVSGGSVSSGEITSGNGGSDDWKEYPDRLDLYVYQGDDVQIPLYFINYADPTLDMSNENDFEWKSQIRVVHRYASTLVNEFSIESQLIPAVPPDTVNQTLVTLFLPRFHNQHPGMYHWDLYSISPFVGPDFPKPPDVDDDEWPMADQIKTWIYGRFYVVPRVTATDWLPVPPTGAISSGAAVVVTPGGFVVGPNGRVP